MPADQSVTEINDLSPLGLNDAPGGAYEASFMAEHDYAIATDDEFVCFKCLKLKRFGQRPKVLLDFATPSPWMRPWHLGRLWRKKFHVVCKHV
jgi:hypothetical protein